MSSTRTFCLYPHSVLGRAMLFVLLALLPLSAQADPRDYAIELRAEVQKSPAKITLRWRSAVDGQLTVARRLSTSSEWSTLATISGSTTSFEDTNVQPGVGYEYRVLKQPVPNYGGSGYIFAGIDLPLVENRGKVILVVDNTHAAALSSELARLEQDLVGDGWTVLRRDVGRNQKPSEVKAIIKSAWETDRTNVRSVFLFGHVPVPYSGNIAPDGHEPDHKGAWPADAYYGDMDGNWTDSSVNATGAHRAENKNVPGDGKFDQSSFPSAIDLEIGRVDLANLPGFAPKTELDLLRQYLNKDHNFRHTKTTVPRRGLVNDNFGDMYGEAFGASGYRNFSAFFGSDNITSIPGYLYFDRLKSEGYLWSYACGGGAYNFCNYVGGTGDFGVNDVQTVFTFLLGSYFGDWDANNAFLRGPLGSPTYGLTAAWAGRPHWFVHHMALGETIGYGTKLTQNGGYNPRQYEKSVHIALMGDPTLRLHPVRPVSNVKALQSGGSVQVSWNASTDTDLQGYAVYKASSASGPFTRVNPQLATGASFTDNSSPGAVYMVKAVKLERSASGSYFNSSQGITTTVTQGGGGTTEPVPLTITRAPAGGIVIGFPSTIGKQYVLESSTNLRNWGQVQTITATALLSLLTQSDATPSAFYRVRQL